MVPLATPGYSSHQGLARLRRDLGWLQADVVTACFGWNDIGLRAQSDAAAMKTDWPSVTARGLVSRSQALVHASRWLRSRRGAPRPDTVRRVSRERYVDNLLEMARVARGHGARAVLIGSVYRTASRTARGDVMGEDRAALRTRRGRPESPTSRCPS